VIEDIAGMLFMAFVGAILSFVVLAFSKSAEVNMRRALIIQSTVILGMGFLFFLGAGLQSPSGYPHLLIPVVFLIALGGAHLTWRLGADRK
jgi:hypothetical protein